MEYIATKQEAKNFYYLHGDLSQLAIDYGERNSIYITTEVITEPTYSEFLVRKRSVPFGIPTTVISIFPPYKQENVYVDEHEIEFTDLGIELRQEVSNFWNFGRRYHSEVFEPIQILEP